MDWFSWIPNQIWSIGNKILCGLRSLSHFQILETNISQGEMFKYQAKADVISMRIQSSHIRQAHCQLIYFTRECFFHACEWITSLISCQVTSRPHKLFLKYSNWMDKIWHRLSDFITKANIFHIKLLVSKLCWWNLQNIIIWTIYKPI